MSLARPPRGPRRTPGRWTSATWTCSAAFVFIGSQQPRTDRLPPSVAVDPKGFIVTGADAARSGRWPLTDREPCAVETTCPGVFAAGDVRSNTTKRPRSPSATGHWRSPAHTGCSRSFDRKPARSPSEETGTALAAVETTMPRGESSPRATSAAARAERVGVRRRRRRMLAVTCAAPGACAELIVTGSRRHGLACA